MVFKKLHVFRPARVKKMCKHISDSNSSMRTFVGKLSLSNLRSSMNGSMASSYPLPTTIHCGLSEGVSSHVALAAGSYFDVEALLFQGFEALRPGAIKSSEVGYMSPYFGNSETEQPTYEEVMSGASGHIFVVKIELSDPVRDFEALIRFFYSIHDPTTRYRQGQNRGFQFASWIFCGDQEQYDVAKSVRGELQGLLNHGALQGLYSSSVIGTNMSIMGEFIAGPAAHQKFYLKNDDWTSGSYIRFKTWPVLRLAGNTGSSGDDSSMASGSSASEDMDLEASIRSSHFRQKDGLVHTMLRISMCDHDEERDDASAF
jgi:peptide-methionine (S)-S-oxide reductase